MLKSFQTKIQICINKVLQEKTERNNRNNNAKSSQTFQKVITRQNALLKLVQPSINVLVFVLPAFKIFKIKTKRI